MKEIIYYYGIIYIIYIVKNIYERFQKKELEDIEIDLTDVSTSLTAAQKFFTFDFMWFIVNMIWMFIGCFSEEHFKFMILLVFFTITFPIISILTQTSKSNTLSLITNIGRLLLVIYIIYHHFFITNN